MDKFCEVLFEESKRFLEKAKDLKGADEADEQGRTAYLHASVYLASCALEGYVNSIASDFVTRPELSLHEKAFLSEKEVRLENGAFVVKEVLKMARLEDRISYLCARYGQHGLPTNEPWWTAYQSGIDIRNRLTHPKAATHIAAAEVERYLEAVIELLHFLFRRIYKKAFPLRRRRLQSKMVF